MINIENFDFLIGKWNFLNRRLKERLVSANDWIAFHSQMETNWTMTFTRKEE